MAVETVRVFVEDQNSDPIEGVLVRVFDATGVTFLSQDFTDALGIADFSLDGDDPPIEYQVRLSKTGVAFDGNLGDSSKSPQLIEVYSPPASSPSGTDDFTVIGQTFERPAATDPRLCRASGFFKRPDAQPYGNLDVIFTPVFKPTVVDGNAVMGGQIHCRTDVDGYLEIDLYRNGEYKVSVETLEDCPRLVVVPDLPSENLIDLLFPVVEEVVFDPTSVALAVGESIEVVPTVTGSDSRVLEDPLQTMWHMRCWIRR